MTDPRQDSQTGAARQGDTAAWIDAIEFVDDAIDAVEDINTLPVEAFATLAILQVVRVPDRVRVCVTRSQRMVILEYEVHEDDIGQVIGRGGHTIDAVRSLVKSITGKTTDPEGGPSPEYNIHLVDDRDSPVLFNNPRSRRRSYKSNGGGRGSR